MKIEKGQEAPDFELYNSEKKAVRLSDQRGSQVLLLFFPAAFTSTCTKELCATRDDLNWYNQMNAKVYGISTDSIYSLAKYKAELNLNFELLADYNKDVSELYGANYELFHFGMKGTSRRAAFIIDEDGIVAYAEVLESAGDLPDFNRIKAILNRD